MGHPAIFGTPINSIWPCIGRWDLFNGRYLITYLPLVAYPFGRRQPLIGREFDDAWLEERDSKAINLGLGHRDGQSHARRVDVQEKLTRSWSTR
jgi:hypothetical protein